MGKIAVVTDSNSGITQEQAKEYGVNVLPMPFFINGETYFEDIDLTQEQFYEKLENDAEISTSMPAVGSVTDLWDSLLKEYEEIVHIPMSSGLSSSCETAIMLSQEYEGRVQVVNNQRISVTQKQSVLDAAELVKRGLNAEEIKNYLEKTKFDSSIYIMVDTLYYLKKGGRVTPAAAALGTLLKLKPVLQIQGDKLDAFAKARTTTQGKSIMTGAVKNDIGERFGGSNENVWLFIAHSHNEAGAKAYREELKKEFPGQTIEIQNLSLSIGCHLGPGALALACSRKIV